MDVSATIHSALPVGMSELLSEFDDVFQKPSSQPSPRTHDHSMHLVPNFKPINLRPCRFSHSQKDEIERQVSRMLHSQIVRPSRSHFASPVVLVKSIRIGMFIFDV